jgi:hypothetical protein
MVLVDMLPTTPERAPMAGDSWLLPAVLSEVESPVHATAASENTAIAATSSHIDGFRILLFAPMTFSSQVDHYCWWSSRSTKNPAPFETVFIYRLISC